MAAKVVVVSLLLLAACERGPRKQAAAPVVAAAADLNAALPEIAALFARETGDSVRLTFGSSGAFTQQIESGAPFEVFLSADERYIERLTARGLTIGEGARYAAGRIVLFLPSGSRIAPDSQLVGLAEAVKNGLVTKFAIANPEHAPYGRAAQQALERAGIWRALQSSLVLGENAAQATQFATSGSAEGGIIPMSLAQSASVAQGSTVTLIDQSLHEPLRQRAALLKGAGETARAFYDFLQTPAAQAIFRQYGFLPPT